MLQMYLLHVSMQYVVVFFGLLDFLGQLGSGLVQLLIQSMMGTLQLGKFLHKKNNNYKPS